MGSSSSRSFLPPLRPIRLPILTPGTVTRNPLLSHSAKESITATNGGTVLFVGHLWKAQESRPDTVNLVSISSMDGRVRQAVLNGRMGRGRVCEEGLGCVC